MNEGGWFGSMEEMLHVLRTAGADRDADGRFLVTPEFAVYQHGAEVVVPPTATFLKNGEPQNLAILLNQTSYGLRGITVIIGEE